MEQENKDIKYEQLKKEHENTIHASYSEISLFSKCPFRHLIEKHLDLLPQEKSIHLIFGDSIHKTLEMMANPNIHQEAAVNFFRNTFQKTMLDEMVGTKEYKEDLKMFTAQGESIIKSLNLEKTFENYTTIGVEKYLYEKCYDNYYFKLFIDRILKHKTKNKIVIIDWKSSGIPWEKKYKLSHYDRKDIKKEEINIKDPAFVFICQMLFYAFFYGRQNNIPLEDIECTYVVLNRLKDRHSLNFPGPIQKFTIYPTKDLVNAAKRLLFETFNKIYKTQTFDKIKITGNEKYGCKFCPLKGEKVVKLKNEKKLVCNKNPRQDKALLKYYGKLITNNN